MPFIIANDLAKRPRVLVINPNSTETFSQAMNGALSSETCALDFYTPSQDAAPASIEGSTDSVLSAAACLIELRPLLERWNGFIIACFSAHPLTHALRELTTAPCVSILEAPLLLASTLGSNVGILTTSPRWVPLLTHDIASLHLSGLNAAGVVSSGMSVLDLENLPRDEVLDRLGSMARDELQDRRNADVIVLGCAGMVGLESAVKLACKPGIVVLDPVRCGLEICTSLIRLGATTSKLGINAPV